MKKTILSSLLILSMLSTGCKKDEIIEPTKKPTTVSTGSTTSGCTSVQCYATAKSTGNRCKNKTTNCNGRCYTHQ